MNSIEILKKARRDLIKKSKADSSVNNQIAEISEAIKTLEFCHKHEISYKDQVIEVQPLDHFHYTKLIKHNNNDQPYEDYSTSDGPVELTGYELIISRYKYNR